jgi:hypothetical protein
MAESLVTLENGISIGIFPGGVFTDVDSSNIEDTYVNHSKMIVVLSSSGRYSMIIHRDERRVHVTEYISSTYRSAVEEVLRFRNLFTPQIFISERFSPSSIPNKQQSSLWLIHTDPSMARKDDLGWVIIAEDVMGHFLSICPFNLRLRLRWVKKVSFSKAPYQQLCAFECYQTVCDTNVVGPISHLIKQLYLHAYKNGFRSIHYNSIFVPFYSEQDEPANNGSLQRHELMELEQIAPWTSIFSTSPTSTSTVIQQAMPSSHIAAQRLQGVDIVYLSRSRDLPEDGVSLREMIPPIFGDLLQAPLFPGATDGFGESNPIALAWPSLTATKGASSSDMGDFIVAVRTDVVQLFRLDTIEASETPRVTNASVHRDLLFSLIASQIPDHVLKETPVLPPVPGQSALNWFVACLGHRPFLVDVLLTHTKVSRHPNRTAGDDSPLSGEESITVVEGPNRCRYTAFHTSDGGLYRLRGLYRSEQTILDYDLRYEVFSVLLATGEELKFTLQDYEDDVVREEGEQDTYLPVPVTMVEQLLAMIRHCRSPGTSGPTDRSIMESYAKEAAMAEEERIQHELFLRRLCESAYYRTELQEKIAELQPGYRKVTKRGMSRSQGHPSSPDSVQSLLQSLEDPYAVAQVELTASVGWGDSSVLSIAQDHETEQQRYLRERLQLQEQNARDAEQGRWAMQQHVLCLQMAREAMQRCETVATEAAPVVQQLRRQVCPAQRP